MNELGDGLSFVDLFFKSRMVVILFFERREEKKKGSL